MIRTFEQHALRESRELDGPWDFVTDPDNRGVAEQWFHRFPEDGTRMFVPSCWNNEMSYFEYEGVAWYRRTFELSREQHIRLLFHAVLGHADVYLDGQHLGYHYGGYSPFEFIVPSAAKGVHELIVRTDSTLNRQTIPIDLVDWFHYGGIIRPVELQPLPDVFIEKLNIRYELKALHTGTAAAGSAVAAYVKAGAASHAPATGDAAVRIEAVLRSLGAGETTVPVRFIRDGEAVGSQECTVPAGQSVTVELAQDWDGVKLWNVGYPALYTVTVATAEDDITDRTGFRKIDVKDGQIRINEEPVYLQGVNRHEEHPEWGFAFPPKLMKKDLDIALELGCNTVRGSHYPQSKYWIDLLDEHGLVFWSEIPMWGAHMPKEVTVDPVFQERALQMIDEMMDRDMHHPSIVFWSMHNEIDTTCEEGYDISQKLTTLARSKDSSRLIAYATMHPLKDIVMPLFDVIGINKYHGWYEGKVDGFTDMLTQFHARAEMLGAGDRPVLMTEFGAAGIFGDTGWEPRLFSEDYQEHVVSEALRIFRDDPRIVGTYIWQFADVRADLKSYRSAFRDRARSFNNKGLVNEFRKPKQAYRAVRGIYRAEQ